MVQHVWLQAFSEKNVPNHLVAVRVVKAQHRWHLHVVQKGRYQKDVYVYSQNYNKRKETPMVVNSNAVVDPWAMMIVSLYALVAGCAVEWSRGLYNQALRAQLYWITSLKKI